MNNQPQEQPEKKRQRKTRGRSKGEGSVFKRSGNDRNKPWVAQITSEKGKKTVIGYYKTEAEAIAARNKALRDLEQGTRIASSKQTMAQYLDYWLEHVHKPTLKLTSYANYRSALDSRLIPALGHIQVQKLTMRQIQLFLSELLNEVAAGRVRYLYAILHSALDHAVTEGLIVRNVCQGVKLPRLEKTEQQILTPEQAELFLTLLQEDKWWKAFLAVAVTTGLRSGEMRALKWQDIDFEKGELQVRRNLVFLKGRGLVEMEPKSTHSRRKIKLATFVIELLQARKQDQEEARLKASNSWTELDLVFSTRKGTHLYHTNLNKQFAKLLSAAGLPPMHVHGLRHSMVTILLMMGVPAHVVQEIAGHSHISITLGTYGHVLPGQQGDTMKIWDNMFGDKNKEEKGMLRQQWSRYSTEVQNRLEVLMDCYGEEAAQIALDILNLMRSGIG